MDSRNERILNDIKNGFNPILDYEERLLQDLFNNYIRKQRLLANHLKDAMSQSSETWHDNAPAEVIIKESELLAKNAEDLSRFLANSTVYCSKIQSHEATLGSYCKISYIDDDKVLWIHLVGSNLVYTNHNSTSIIDSTNMHPIDNASIHSPLAKILIGKHADLTKTLYVGEKLKIRLLAVKAC